MSERLTYHHIVDIGDDILLPWLDLYEQAFPPDEKVPVSDHLRALKEGRAGAGPPAPIRLLAALDAEGALVAMARYDVTQEPPSAYLMYLAVAEARRCGGIGAQVYAEICRRLEAERPPVDALLFEVEIPKHAADAEARVNAERRIRFYQRAGARLLRGIHYEQVVPGQPPVPMYLMAHPFRPMNPEAVYALAAQMFDVSRTGAPLVLE